MLVERTSLEARSPRGWNLIATSTAIVALALLASVVEGPVNIAQAAPGDDKQGEVRSGGTFKKTEAATDAKQDNRISYNDGTSDHKRSIGGSGELISFKLPKADAKVAGIRIHASRYGYPQAPKENAMIYFLNQDLSETIATKTVPYSRFKRGEQQWVDVKFTKPIEVPEEFWVCLDFRAEQTKGVYVSIDSSSDGSHSKIGLPGSEPRDANIGGDWMVEVVLAK